MRHVVYTLRDCEGMKVFVWIEVDQMSNNYHCNGSVVVFAESESRAREIANVNGCAIKPEELPVDVRECSGEEKAYWMPNAGCC